MGAGPARRAAAPGRRAAACGAMAPRGGLRPPAPAAPERPPGRKTLRKNQALFFAAGPQLLQQGLAAQESPVPERRKHLVKFTRQFCDAYRVAEALLKAV